jgi:hypothetical protein
LARSTTYKAPHCILFSSLLLFHPSLVQISYSVTLFSNTLSLMFFHQCERLSLTWNYRQNNSFVYLDLYVFWQQTIRKWVPNWMEKICLILICSSFPHEPNSCYCCSWILELRHIFKNSVSYLCVMSLNSGNETWIYT